MAPMWDCPAQIRTCGTYEHSVVVPLTLPDYYVGAGLSIYGDIWIYSRDAGKVFSFFLLFMRKSLLHWHSTGYLSGTWTSHHQLVADLV